MCLTPGHLTSSMFFGGCAWASNPGLGRAQGMWCLLRDASPDTHSLNYSSTPQPPPRQYQNRKITGVFVWVLAGYSHWWRGVHDRDFGFVQAVSAAHGLVLRCGRFTVDMRPFCKWRGPDSWGKACSPVRPAWCWRNHTARHPVIEREGVRSQSCLNSLLRPLQALLMSGESCPHSFAGRQAWGAAPG